MSTCGGLIVYPDFWPLPCEMPRLIYISLGPKMSQLMWKQPIIIKRYKQEKIMSLIPTHRTPTHPGEMLLEEFLGPMGITQR